MGLRLAVGAPVMAGDAVLAPGRVYDPAADRWARTEPLPLEPEDALHDPYVTWTGEALVVFGGVLHSCPPDEDCDIAADEPQTLSGWLYLS
jgi:hypothetical protein